MTHLFFPGWGVPLDEYAAFAKQNQLTLIDYGYFPEQKLDFPTFRIPKDWPLDEAELLILFRTFFAEKICISGHSLGTIYALKLAALCAQSIEKIKLYSPFCAFISNDEFTAHDKSGILSMFEKIPTEPDKVLSAFYRQLFAPDRKRILLPTPIDINALERDLLSLFSFDVRPLISVLRPQNIEVEFATKDIVVPPQFTHDFIKLLLIDEEKIISHQDKGHAFLFNSIPLK